MDRYTEQARHHTGKPVCRAADQMRSYNLYRLTSDPELTLGRWLIDAL